MNRFRSIDESPDAEPVSPSEDDVRILDFKESIRQAKADAVKEMKDQAREEAEEILKKIPDLVKKAIKDRKKQFDIMQLQSHHYYSSAAGDRPKGAARIIELYCQKAGITVKVESRRQEYNNIGHRYQFLVGTLK